MQRGDRKKRQESDQHERERSRERERDKAKGKGKSGRPSKKKKQLESQIEEPEDHEKTETQANTICENIHQSLLDFNVNVGLNKGFVLDQKEREQLINKQKEEEQKHLYIQEEQTLKWTQEHQWNRETERSKIQKICNTIKDCGFPHKFKDVMINTSYLFAQEFTYQYYKIGANVWKILNMRRSPQKTLIEFETDPQLKTSLQLLANNIYNNLNGEYYLLSLEFKAPKNEKKRKKQAQSATNHLSAYVRLVNDLAQQLEKLFE